MKAKKGAKTVPLTADDWIEIECALEAKIMSLEKGHYGVTSATKSWVRHLKEIIIKIGPYSALGAKRGK